MMIVYTDHPKYAESLITDRLDWHQEDISRLNPNLQPLIKGLDLSGLLFVTGQKIEGDWTHAFIIHHASSSHFDLLIELSQRNLPLPDRILCLAGTGPDFHGQKGRPWAAVEGNIHLTLYFAPDQKIERFHVGFPILAAVSLIEAIETIKGLSGRASIKWINDVLIDGAKVAGFLVHTSSIEETVTAAVVGIGLNVENTPPVQRNAFVPKVASLRSFIPDPSVCNQKSVLRPLLQHLDKNYRHLLYGRYSQLLDFYRKRSLVIGRNVKILSDMPPGQKPEAVTGRVRSIGENLELYLENIEKPVTKGRLILID